MISTRYDTLAVLCVFLSAALNSANALASVEKQAPIRRECQSEIEAAAKMIEDGRNVRVLDVTQRDFSDRYSEGYPSEASFSLDFRMEGRAAADIMHSPQFMNNISANIIESCQSVSLVEFSVSQTDWASVYGLIDGSVLPFSCIGSGDYTGEISWGERICL